MKKFEVELLTDKEALSHLACDPEPCWPVLRCQPESCWPGDDYYLSCPPRRFTSNDCNPCPPCDPGW